MSHQLHQLLPVQFKSFLAAHGLHTTTSLLTIHDNNHPQEQQHQQQQSRHHHSIPLLPQDSHSHPPSRGFQPQEHQSHQPSKSNVVKDTAQCVANLTSSVLQSETSPSPAHHSRPYTSVQSHAKSSNTLLRIHPSDSAHTRNHIMLDVHPATAAPEHSIADMSDSPSTALEVRKSPFSSSAESILSPPPDSRRSHATSSRSYQTPQALLPNNTRPTYNVEESAHDSIQDCRPRPHTSSPSKEMLGTAAPCSLTDSKSAIPIPVFETLPPRTLSDENIDLGKTYSSNLNRNKSTGVRVHGTSVLHNHQPSQPQTSKRMSKPTSSFSQPPTNKRRKISEFSAGKSRIYVPVQHDEFFGYIGWRPDPSSSELPPRFSAKDSAGKRSMTRHLAWVTSPSEQQQEELQQPRVRALISSKDDSQVAREQSQKYACRECAFEFHEQSLLEEHYLSAHGTPKPYQCEICRASFGRKGVWKKHIQMVHEGQRKFECDVPGCGHSFGLKSDLKRHTQSVHLKQRPFVCQICSASFGRKSDLKRHTQSLHPGAHETVMNQNRVAGSTRPNDIIHFGGRFSKVSRGRTYHHRG